MPKARFSSQEIVRTLLEHKVEFIVVGGVCAALQGAPITTFDLDIVHRRSAKNLTRLLAALRELDAHYREHRTRKIRPKLSHLSSPGHQLLETEYGPMDVLGSIEDELSYEDLLPDTFEFRSKGMKVRLLNLEKLVELKEKSHRDKDKAVLPILRRTLRAKRKP
jgi:predicted nucleotidyltransferase